MSDTKQYVSWWLKFQHFCLHKYNADGVPLSYVIRDKVPPEKFNTLLEELGYLLLVDMSNAQFRADLNLIYSYLEAAIKAEKAKPLMQNKTKLLERNGCANFLQMNSCFEGDDAKPFNISEMETKLGKLSWNNNAKTIRT